MNSATLPLFDIELGNHDPFPVSKSKTYLWRDALSKELYRVGDALIQFEKSYDVVKSHISEHYYSHHRSAIESVVNAWMKETIEREENLFSCMGHLSLYDSIMPDYARTFSFRKLKDYSSEARAAMRRIDIHNASIHQLIELVNTYFDFDKLETHIEKGLNDKERSSLTSAADHLGTTFYFYRHTGYRANSCLDIKKQKGRFLIEIRHHETHAYQRANSLLKHVPSAELLEEESSTNGLSECLQHCAELERATDGNIASRTKVNSGGEVEATYFNEKIRFAFSETAFEALVSFIREYASIELLDLRIV